MTVNCDVDSDVFVCRLTAVSAVSVKLYLRHGRTDGLRSSVRPFVRLSLCQGRPAYRGTNLDAS